MRTLLILSLLLSAPLAAQKTLPEVVQEYVQGHQFQPSSREIDQYCAWEDRWLGWGQFRDKAHKLDASLTNALEGFEETIRSAQRQRARCNIASWKMGKSLFDEFGGKVVLLKTSHPLVGCTVPGLPQEQIEMLVGHTKSVEVPMPIEALHLYLESVGEFDANFNLETTLEGWLQTGAARVARNRESVLVKPYWTRP